MTREDCHAGVLLSDALKEMSDIYEGFEEAVGAGYDYRAFELSVGDYCSAGSANISFVVVDLETGKRIAREAERIIRERLAELKVETGEEPADGKPA